MPWWWPVPKGTKCLPMRRCYHLNLTEFSFWVLTTSERRCALLRTGRATPPIGLAVKFSIQPNPSKSRGCSVTNSAPVANLQQFKRACWKNIWTLDSFPKPAPTYRSVRTPVVVQAPFQNNKPWAFLSSFQFQLKHVFQEKHPITM